jgi:hypothetical protein
MAVEVELVREARDGVAERIAALVNDVYLVAESGLWRDGATRTTPAEVSELIRAGELAAATGWCTPGSSTTTTPTWRRCSRSRAISRSTRSR